MKKTLAITGSIIFIALITVLGVHKWLNSSPPILVDDAENASATKDIVLLAHINNQRFQGLLTSPDTYQTSAMFPFLSEATFKDLYTDLSGLKNNLEHVVFSISSSKKTAFSLLMQGKFNKQDVQDSFNKYFEITSLSNNIYRLSSRETNKPLTSCPNEKVTKVHEDIYLYSDEQWVAISTEKDRLAVVISRLLFQETAEVDLTNWRTYRDKHIASMALFAPEKTSKLLNSLTTKKLPNVLNNINAISTIYMGLDLNLFDNSINLTSKIDATSDWIEGTEKISSAYTNSKTIGKNSSSSHLDALLKNVSITVEEETLTSQLTITEQQKPEIEGAITELASIITSAAESSIEQEIVSEAIQEARWNYRNNDKLRTLKAYKPSTTFGVPALIDGPLAIQLSSAEVTPNNGLLQLGITGGVHLPKVGGWWFNSKAVFNLQIESVTNDAGQEMLRDEKCLKGNDFMEANHEVAHNFQVNNEIGSITKNLRLIPNSTLEEVSNIKGVLSFSIPTKIKMMNIALKKGVSYQEHGIHFSVTDFTQQSLKYKLSGEKDKLLEVRALNRIGQVLQTNYSVNTEEDTTTFFRGDIARIQLVIGTQKSAHQSRFNLSADSLFPERDLIQNHLNKRPGLVSKEQWLNINTFKDEQLANDILMGYLSQDEEGQNKVASWFQSPIAFFITHDVQSEWRSPVHYFLVQPLNEGLAHNLQAIEITTNHKQNQTVNYLNTVPFHKVNDDQSIGKYLAHGEINGVGLLKSKSEVALNIKPKQKLGILTGQININLPSEINAVNVGKPGFDSKQFEHGISMNLTRITNGSDPKYKYKIKAPNLINAIAILSDGKELLPTHQEFSDGYWTLQYPLAVNISHFEVLLATNTNKISYPFEFIPRYQ